jgi:hypothetical protein
MVEELRNLDDKSSINKLKFSNPIRFYKKILYNNILFQTFGRNIILLQISQNFIYRLYVKIFKIYYILRFIYYFIILNKNVYYIYSKPNLIY